VRVARRVGIAIALIAAIAPARPAAAADGPLEIAALTWLGLLDEGRFEDAWREGAPLLRDGVTQERWVAATRRLRDELGRIASRAVIDKAYHRQIEGGPDGTYFTLRIRTALVGAGERIEIVTLTAGADGQYRTVAYGIKR